MKKIGVTGAAGFIGSHLCDRLLADGYEVVGVDDLSYARTIFPDLRQDEILDAVVQRARVTEPVHLLGGAKNIPPMFDVPGLALASTSHVYPEIVSGQAVSGVSQRVVPGILERLPAERREAA